MACADALYKDVDRVPAGIDDEFRQLHSGFALGAAAVVCDLLRCCLHSRQLRWQRLRLDAIIA